MGMLGVTKGFGKQNLRDSLVSTEEDLGIILIQSTLVISNSWHVLDDNAMVRVLALFVQDTVSLNHVINDVGLGYFLGAELLLGAQVLAVIVSEMVVAGNRCQLDAGVDEEVNKSRLHLGLARLEVIAANEGTMLLGQLDGTRDKGILRRTVDERGLLENGGHCENGGGRHFLVALFNSLEEVVSGVINALDEVGISLRVCGPHDNDLVQGMLGLEVTNVLADLLHVSGASLCALNQVVGAILLIGSNEIRVVDGGEGNQLCHLLSHMRLEGRLQNLGSVHGLGQVELADVPAANNKVIGMNHGQDVVERDIDLLVGLGIRPELHGRAHDDGSVVVGFLGALLGVPDKIAAISNDTSSDRGTIVAAPANQHHADLGNLAVDLEVILRLLGSCHVVAIGVGLDASGAVGILGTDFRVRVSDIGRVYDEGALSGTSGRRLSVVITCPVRGARAFFCVRCHIDELMDAKDSQSLYESSRVSVFEIDLTWCRSSPLALRKQSSGLRRTGGES